MQLSQPKTKTMIFNPLRKYDLFPEISIKQGEFTEVVEEQKYWEISGYCGHSGKWLPPSPA